VAGNGRLRPAKHCSHWSILAGFSALVIPFSNHAMHRMGYRYSALANPVFHMAVKNSVNHNDHDEKKQFAMYWRITQTVTHKNTQEPRLFVVPRDFICGVLLWFELRIQG
jgi:hypothetical protein